MRICAWPLMNIEVLSTVEMNQEVAPETTTRAGPETNPDVNPCTTVDHCLQWNAKGPGGTRSI
jgi:hypothetical protein